MTKPILAAGTICWRRPQQAGIGAPIEVLLIHRDKQQDVSFPKGKLRKGESMPRAAVRETAEETGLRVTLGANLGTITYQLPNGGERKTVQYWAARVSDGALRRATFTPNREVQALEWVPLPEVPQRLSYQADRDLFEVFERLVARDAVDTFSVILLRHGAAAPRGALWPEDHLRPLTDPGEDQAETLVPMLAAFGPKRLITSSAVRCVRTLAPLADRLGRELKVREGLSQAAWELGDTAGLRQIATQVLRKAKNSVLCTHRPVLPDLARELAVASGTLPGEYLTAASALPPAGFSVLHFSRQQPTAGILSVESYPLQH